MRLSELAALMLWSKSRLSHHLTRMRQRGLVEREERPGDARGSVIVLSPAGLKAIEEATAARRLGSKAHDRPPHHGRDRRSGSPDHPTPVLSASPPPRMKDNRQSVRPRIARQVKVPVGPAIRQDARMAAEDHRVARRHVERSPSALKAIIGRDRRADRHVLRQNPHGDHGDSRGGPSNRDQDRSLSLRSLRTRRAADRAVGGAPEDHRVARRHVERSPVRPAITGRDRRADRHAFRVAKSCTAIMATRAEAEQFAIKMDPCRCCTDSVIEEPPNVRAGQPEDHRVARRHVERSPVRPATIGRDRRADRHALQVAESCTGDHGDWRRGRAICDRDRSPAAGNDSVIKEPRTAVRCRPKITVWRGATSSARRCARRSSAEIAGPIGTHSR